MAQEGQLVYIPRPSTAARWSNRGSESPSDMDMTRSLGLCQPCWTINPISHHVQPSNYFRPFSYHWLMSH